MVNGPAAAMTRLRFAAAEACDESVTAAVKLNVPVAAGVPERTPLLAKVTPPGSDPADTLQLYPVPVPPAAVSVAEYETLTVPPASDVVVMESGVAPEDDEEPPPQLCRG